MATPIIWENNRVKKVLKALPIESQEAYKQEFVDNFSQGYYPLGQGSLPSSPGCISFVLSTGERVIYRIVDSKVYIVYIDRIDTSAFLWKLWDRFAWTLDQIGRVMTLQQILAFLATKLF